MTTISSHVLDSVSGTHAANIRVELYRTTGPGVKECVFDVVANAEGRISESISITHHNRDSYYELIFHTGKYFQLQNENDISITKTKKPLLEFAVVRLNLHDDNQRYHIPLVLSPHSYTIWWSE